MVEAGHISDENANFEAVVLVDEVSGDAFELQRSLVFDEQDRDSGQDTYCLVRSGASHYGGLVNWRVESGTLTLTFTDAAATALDLPVETEIPVSASAESVIRANFPRLLG